MSDVKPWDDVSCKTVHYGAFDTGTRTMYDTPIPLWEEIVTSGNRYFGGYSTFYTAFPEELPETLPVGAKEMGIDKGVKNPYAWIDFGCNEEAAFAYAMNLEKGQPNE